MHYSYKLKMQNHSMLSTPLNPLLRSFLPQSSDNGSTTTINFYLRPRIGSILSQPMPAYRLQNHFPPSDKFPQSQPLSPHNSSKLASFTSPTKPQPQNSQYFPASPSDVIKVFKAKLTEWEQNEILSYPVVYTIGLNATKIHANTTGKSNFGFDNDQGRYKVVLGDHIAYRYEICEVYGNGTFGIVVKALDVNQNRYLALKIVDKKSHVGEEAEMLGFIKSRDGNGLYGVVDFYGSLSFRGHTVIILEVLSINLYDFLKDTHFEGVSPNLIRRIASQILQTLAFLHKYSIIHCDLKPENILFKELNRSLVKLVDFGTACFEGRNAFTYIQSRYYRAPEIILGLNYTTAIDVWSLGCILAELHAGSPIFAGENEADQMFCIMEYCGLPPQGMVSGNSHASPFFESNGEAKDVKTSRNGVRKPNSKLFSDFLRGSDANFMELVKKCLVIDPKDRISAKEALLDPWLMDFSMKVVPIKKEPIRRRFSLTAPK